ncbi:FkbM family methyltransferase [Methylobacterium fujisawaense]
MDVVFSGNGLPMFDFMAPDGNLKGAPSFDTAGFFQVTFPDASGFAMLSIADCNVMRSIIQGGRGAFEPFSLRIWSLLVKRASLALDIGAYTGIYALLAAAANPSCLTVALEANPVTFGRLVTNLLANRFADRIAPLNMGASSRSGSLDLSLHGGIYTMSSGESLEMNSHGGAFAVKRVQTISIDELLLRWKDFYPSDLTLPLGDRRLQLVKIDVEGHERSVLSGMRQSIERDRPTMLVEILSPADLPDLISSYPGYRAYWVDEAGRLSREHVPGSLNVLFVPTDGVGWHHDLEEKLGVSVPV